MTIQWPWVLLALVLLAPPPFLSSELRRVVISARRNAELRVASVVRPWQNWLDFARGFLGALVLTELALLPDPVKDLPAKRLLFQVLLLAVSLLFQVVRIDTKVSRSEQKVQLLAPIFYLCGVTLVLSRVLGAFGVFVGWAFAAGSKNPAYQLPAMGVGLIAGGSVFGFGTSLLCNVALIGLPFLAAFAMRKRLVFVGTERHFSDPVLKVT